MKLTELAIKRPAFMAMIFAALAVFGMFSYSRMGVDLLPKMDWPMVMVATAYPGAGPQEIENQISKPIEEALSSINGLKSIRTYSSENFSFCMLEFQMSANVGNVLNDVERKMSQIRSTFPDGVKEPEINKVDINSFPILRVASRSKMEPQRFYQFMKDTIKPRLEQIEGVSVVELVGGKQREIRVEVDNEKLRHYNLSIQQVSQALTLENLDFPTGSIQQKDRKYTVRVAGKFQALSEVENLILVNNPSGTIYLKDVATIKDTSNEEFTFSRFNGDSAIGVIIQKASDANAVKTSAKIRQVFIQMEKEFSQNELKFTIAVDITNFTKDAIKSVKKDLFMAVLMVAFILFIFLHNIKSSLIVLLSIPTSIVTTFIMMNILGFSINLMTMMAMTLVIGILVDDSIVVLENIHRHLKKGENQYDAAINGRSEIGMAAIAITLVDVVVFFPIAMVSGIVGKIFREFGLTIVTATLVSLFVSFTLTPLLASRWSKLGKFEKDSWLHRFTMWFDRFEEKMSRGYRSVLESALRHKFLVIMISFLALISSFVLVGMGFVGTEFMHNPDRGEFAINLEFAKGTGIEENDAITRKVEQILVARADVKSYYTIVGRKEEPWGGSNRSDISQIQVNLIELKKRKPTNDVISELLKELGKIPGLKSNIGIIGIFGASEDKPLQIELKGTNMEDLIISSEILKKVVEAVPGTRDVSTTWESGKPEVQVKINRERCAYYQTTVGEVGGILRNALEGNKDTKFKEGDTEYDLKVILDKKYRTNPDNVKNILITNHKGEQIRLEQVADVFFGIGPNMISRKDKSRVITVMANNTLPTGQIKAGIDKGLAKVKFPPGVSIFFAGDFQSQSDMNNDLGIALLFAVLFVYMIMVSLFESYTYPFIIMFSLPVALVGGLYALAVTHETLNVFSMIGIILSMGLVSKNAILLVDYTNTLRKRGRDIVSALLEAGPVRLRPIIMTTMTMVFGMLPIAMSSGSGADMRKGLAIVVIGALISSTLLTLVLVPVVYTIVEGIKAKFGFGEKKEIEFSQKEE